MSGKLLNKWESGKNRGPASERFTDALKQIEQGKKERATLFERQQQEMQAKKRLADDAFNKRLQEIKDSGDNSPPEPRDIDL